MFGTDVIVILQKNFHPERNLFPKYAHLISMCSGLKNHLPKGMELKDDEYGKEKDKFYTANMKIKRAFVVRNYQKRYKMQKTDDFRKET